MTGTFFRQTDLTGAAVAQAAPFERPGATRSTKAPRTLGVARNASPSARPPLGDTLLKLGFVSRQDLARALSIANGNASLLPTILVRHGIADASDICRAEAVRFGTQTADFDSQPPDPRLIDAVGLSTCLGLNILPWKRVGGTLVVATPDPETLLSKPDLPDQIARARIVTATPENIRTALVSVRHRELAARAEGRTPDALSCRIWSSHAAARLGLAIVLAIATAFLLSPVVGFAALTVWASATLFVNVALKLTALALHIADRSDGTPETSLTNLPTEAVWPTISILVPLFKEREIAGRLVERLSVLDYPRDRLDICLVVEDDDAMTRGTLARTKLPPWMRQITVPQGTIRTKPRAMNFALDFCEGQIIGVYDAEDAPEPDQLRKVAARFARSGPWVACLQGRLDFYNPHSNWLSRCFTIDYAGWFRIILPGMARIGFALPLGGTTVFFRRSALEAIGGWDAHNVTEDADLGIRLARYGLRTEMIDTVTREEANCRPWPWIKQRSRWIKGYAMTYGVLMRRPGKLLGQLGLWKFIGVQVVFLASLSQALLAPVLWSFWVATFGIAHPLIDAMPWGLFWLMGGCFVAAELVNIVLGLFAVRAAGHDGLARWVPSMQFYAPLATVAAVKGLWELVSQPFFWDKTQHGLVDQPDRRVPDTKLATAAPNPT